MLDIVVGIVFRLYGALCVYVSMYLCGCVGGGAEGRQQREEMLAQVRPATLNTSLGKVCSMAVGRKVYK